MFIEGKSNLAKKAELNERPSREKNITKALTKVIIKIPILPLLHPMRQRCQPKNA